MARKGQHARTPYTDKMEAAIQRLIGGIDAAFNQEQLAAEMGVNRTNAFRARLQQMVDDGRLHSFPYYTPKKGVGTAYTHPVPVQMALPDMDKAS